MRILSMNAAHISCRRDQVEEEFRSVMKMTMAYFKIFGLGNYWFRLSKWNPERKEKYIAEPDSWNFSEEVLRSVLKKLKVPFVEVSDEAAFYGPKVDAQFKSVIGREETMSTIQLDFAAKRRFHLTFANDKGEAEESVFVIHQAPLSTHERFMAFLIEHYAGAFPVWLSPVQVAVIPVSEKHVKMSRTLGVQLTAYGLRLHLDDANESVGYKIRRAERQKVPYMLVLGDKEIPKSKKWSDETKLSVRVRGQKKLIAIQLKKFLERVTRQVTRRKD